MTSELMSNINFSINTDTNVYYNTDGDSVPRVTTILSTMIHSDALMVWSNVLGLKGVKYQSELNRAASFGTQAHSCIEKYLKSKIKSKNNIPFLGYLLWETCLKQRGIIISPVFIERKLACKWFGGTCDAVIEINGKTYIIDFKTSNHITYKYFLQLAAYIYMLNEEGIRIDGAIVLQLDKKEPGFNEYLLDFSIAEHADFMNHCSDTFFALVYAYYQINRVNNEFRCLYS